MHKLHLTTKIGGHFPSQQTRYPVPDFAFRYSCVVDTVQYLCTYSNKELINSNTRSKYILTHLYDRLSVTSRKSQGTLYVSSDPDRAFLGGKYTQVMPDGSFQPTKLKA